MIFKIKLIISTNYFNVLIASTIQNC